DAVVVGAGVAGIIVAAKIAEKGVNSETGGPLRIALIERGPYLKGEPRPGYGHPLRRRMFTNIMAEFRAGGRYVMGVYPEGPSGPNTFAIPAGSLVGGGSLHYTAQTRDPHSVDYLSWQRETGVDWSEGNMKAAAREIARTFNIHERPDQLLTKFDLDFREAGRQVGFEVSPTTVAKKNCLYSGFCDGQNMCKYDARAGSFVTYLPIAEENGVEVIPDSEVQRITIEKGKATGVTFIQKGTEYVVKANKIIVSCGILGSPVLLMRSGYGSRQELGDNLLVENANVGQNIDGRAGPFNVDGIFDTPMSDGEFHDGGFHLFHDTRSDKTYDRIQLRSYYPRIGKPHQVALHAEAPEFGREHKDFMRQICNSAVPSAHRDNLLKRGRVTVVVVRSSQVLGHTNIRAEMFYDIGHSSFKRLFLEGSKLAEEVLRTMKVREVQFDQRPIRNVGFLAWAGSCRAGTDPKHSVVNQYGESHDVENLFVCDASILPRCASQGYGGPTATVAAFLADRIAQRHFKL
ncbi:GMC family oxidoreductase, partial [Acidobacteria bacterium AH-259-D05]|nr:GMC family oxidoreductase [Acidobacteria bacterium AH-259-D05]